MSQATECPMNEVRGLRAGLPPLPERIKRLPVSERGYPIPFFVAWLTPEGARAEPGDAGAKPDFRITDAKKAYRVYSEKRCWICGESLGRNLVFVGGPLMVINQVSVEGPCHRDCAIFSATACPFLTNPKMVRNTHDLPREHRKPGGMMLEHNPGVAVLWHCQDYQVKRLTQTKLLWQLGESFNVEYFAEGRAATRAEIEEAVKPGLTALRERAVKEDGWGEMEEALAQFRRSLPEM